MGRVVPGSHTWDLGRAPTAHEVVYAEMDAGSVLLWLGGTLHAAGPNVTDDEWRRGVFISYSLGWLRTEEHFAMELTRDAAARLPERVRQLAGFQMHGELGFYAPDLHGVTARSSDPETPARTETSALPEEPEVGPPLPEWQALPPPPLAPMAGQWCSLEPLSLAAHGDDLLQAYSTPTASGKDIWTYTGPDEGDPTISREVFDDWIKSDVANPSRHIYAVVVPGSGSPEAGDSGGAARRAIGTCAHQAWDAPNGVLEIGHVCVAYQASHVVLVCVSCPSDNL